VQEESVGQLNGKYEDYTADENTKFGYYNTKNIYYRVGYWPNEFYRFGIVFIMNDYSLTPVFNIKGLIKNGESYAENKYGIYRALDLDVLSTNKPIGIKFTVNLENVNQELKENL